MVLDDETKPGSEASSSGTNAGNGNAVAGGAVKGRHYPFRGNFSHTLDEKGRISLPVEFRRVVESDALSDPGIRGQVKGSQRQPAVVLTNYISEGARVIEGFSIGAWEEFEEKLRAKSRFSAKLQKLENFYLSRAAECPLDGSGRILIPAHLRTYAGLTKDCTFTSSVHGFRLWDTRVWNMIFSEAEKALLENPDLFSDVDL